jgi:hypothetical protein
VPYFERERKRGKRGKGDRESEIERERERECVRERGRSSVRDERERGRARLKKRYRGRNVGERKRELIAKRERERERERKRQSVITSFATHLERLLGAVDAAVIDGDANTTGSVLADLASLELGKSEAAAGADAHVVLDGGAPDRGAQEVDRARSELLGLGGARITAADLVGRLVKPCADVLLPVLAEVRVLDGLVMLHPACKIDPWSVDYICFRLPHHDLNDEYSILKNQKREIQDHSKLAAYIFASRAFSAVDAKQSRFSRLLHCISSLECVCKC